MKMKYFHELSEAEIEKLQGIKFEELRSQYKQPDWCNYPEAIDFLGCWSLVYGLVEDEDFCKGCDCYKLEDKQK